MRYVLFLLFFFQIILSSASVDSLKVLQLQGAFADELFKGIENGYTHNERILELSEALGFQNGLLHYELNQAKLFMEEGLFDQAYNTLSNFELEHKNRKQFSPRLNRLFGSYYQSDAKIELASQYFHLALEQSSKLSDSLEISLSLLKLGSFNSAYGDSTLALKFLTTANAYFKDRSHSDHIACLMAIANHYFHVDNYHKSLENQRSILALLSAENQADIANIHLNMGACFAELAILDSSIYYCNKALEYYEKQGRLEDVAIINFNLGVVQLNKGNNDEAIELFNKTLALSEGVFPDLHLVSYQGLSEANAAKEEFELAYNQLYKAFELNDSILNTEKQNQIAEMNAKYDSEKKDQEIENFKLTTELQAKRNYLMLAIASLSILALFFAIIFVRNNRKKTKIISEEKERSESLLLNILPAQIAEELKLTGTAKAHRFEQVTILFSDIQNFTLIGASLSAEELVNELNYCFTAFDQILSNYKVEKIKTVGDAYICAGGIPSQYDESLEQVLEVAKDFQNFMREYQSLRESEGRSFFKLRIGVHTGPVVAGIVGMKKFAYDIWGDTVNTAARMEQACDAGEVNVSEETMILSKGKYQFRPRGPQEVKGKGMMNMFYLD